MTALVISDDLALPLDAVTETLLILGKRGVGKTNTGVVLAEEMIGAGQTVGIIDPTGAWWGLRSDAAGTGPGLPVTILGGEHGDLPLDPGAGVVVADLLIEERLPLVLDLSVMSKTQQRRFVCDFLERLYHKNRDPLHLIIDEADLFAPQRGTAEMARLLGAYEDVVRRGRIRGIGSTSITQRPAGMNTEIRSQPEVLLTLRLIGKHDIVAIDEWVRLHASDEDARELKASLPSLPVGTAWLWSPGWLNMLRRVEIRGRRTFDSSVTPRVGQRRIEPRAQAKVDLQAIQARMAAVVAKAEQDDPKALRRRIADLERQLRQAGGSGRAEVLARDNIRLSERIAELELREPERVEVPVLGDADRERMNDLYVRLGEVRQLWPQTTSLPPAKPVAPTPTPEPPRPVPLMQAARVPGTDPAPLAKAQRAILTVLAQHPAGRTKRQLGMQAGYSAKGGGFNNALSSLRTAGYISRGDPITATQAGIDALGGAWEPLPQGTALIDHWMAQLSKAEAAALRALLDAYPGSLSKDDIAERAGYAAAGGGFNNALSRLRTLQLIDGYGDIRADDTIGAAAND